MSSLLQWTMSRAYNCPRFAVICINICQFGVPHTGPWLLRIMQILFWSYIAMSMMASAIIYLILWSTLWVSRRLMMMLVANKLKSVSHSYHDANLGVSSLPAASYCAVCQQPNHGCRVACRSAASSAQQAGNRALRRSYPRCRVSDSLYDLGGLHLSFNDAEAASRLSEAWCGM